MQQILGQLLNIFTKFNAKSLRKTLMQLCNMAESNLAKPGIDGLHVNQKTQILRETKNKTTNKYNRGYAHMQQKKNGGITGN